MENFEIFILALFVSVAGLNVLARWFSVPYPIPLVLGGVALGLIPGMPEIELDPDLVLVIFLPPLLYAAAFFADLRALRSNARPITLLAIGLVLVTTGVVAVIGHEAIGLTWPMAFALGAIVSPTDPLAATAIMRRLGAPRRIVNVVEGESLVNDATALVAYKVAVAAAVGGSFSVVDAGFEFVWIGARRDCGRPRGRLRGRGDPAPPRRHTDRADDLAADRYAAFVPADAIGVSGVLAAVTTGIYLGWRAPEIASPQTRLQGFALWEMLVFLLNATLFILIGLQLPGDRRRAPEPQCRRGGGLLGARVRDRDRSAVRLDVHGALCSARTRSPSPAAGATRGLAHARRRGMGRHPRRGVARRGARAAARDRCRSAAAGPRSGPVHHLRRDPGDARRAGAHLPWLIRRLGVVEDGAEEEAEEIRARLVASRAALARIDELVVEDWVRDDTAERLRDLHRFRCGASRFRAGKMEDEDGIEDRSLNYQRLLHELYLVQRRALVELRNGGTISNEVMHRIERELDLEESRLEV